ncbi:MAG TPA: 30S ribosomal protein S12 methylthiotransferase RimO, partial [Gemmobacter sp.]|nr:30S ribosomal protein S12 methylthiotransferase RimO [Gemmobacter sp.]
VGRVLPVIIDEVGEPDEEDGSIGATARSQADAPEIDGNLFIDEGFEDLKPGDLVTVEVDEAGEYDLWGRLT